jgi:hypothetical protein
VGHHRKADGRTDTFLLTSGAARIVRASKLKPVGQGRESFVWDYVPGYFLRQRHVRETLACACGQ